MRGEWPEFRIGKFSGAYNAEGIGTSVRGYNNEWEYHTLGYTSYFILSQNIFCQMFCVFLITNLLDLPKSPERCLQGICTVAGRRLLLSVVFY